MIHQRPRIAITLRNLARPLPYGSWTTLDRTSLRYPLNLAVPCVPEVLNGDRARVGEVAGVISPPG
jgi:hypothetical protein